jgi:hypothetical protein
LEAALSIAETAPINAAFAASLSPEAAAVFIFLIAVLVDDLVILLRNCLFAITAMRFFADFIFANVFTSSYENLL